MIGRALRLVFALCAALAVWLGEIGSNEFWVR